MRQATLPKLKGQWPAETVEMRDLESIYPYPNNPRTHPPAQVELLAELMRRHGVDQPIVVDENGVILKGHGRRLAALQAGFKAFPVVVHHDLSDTEKRAIRIADNQSALLSGWDAGLMKIEMGELTLAGYDLPLLGFPTSELQLMQALMAEGEATPPDPPIPDVPANPISKRGDLWNVGGHLVMCGDCREPKDVTRLIGQTKINLAFTSPPYAEQRKYDPASGFKPVAPDDYVAWFAAVSQLVADHLADDGSYFVNIKPSADDLDTSLYVFDLVAAHVRQWGWHFATEYCWERSGVPKNVVRRFKNQFEPVYQFVRGDWKFRPDGVRHVSQNVPPDAKAGMKLSKEAKITGRKENGLPVWGKDDRAEKGMPPAQGKRGAFNARPRGRRSGSPNEEGLQGTKWQSGGMPLGIPKEEITIGLAYPGNRLPTFSSTHEALGHPAAFPVGLPAFFVRAYTDSGDAIYDPFTGSASTLIAAHQNGRVGYGMELSPGYVDVAIERLSQVSGAKPKRLK